MPGDLSYLRVRLFQEAQFGVVSRLNSDDVKVRDLRGDGDSLRLVQHTGSVFFRMWTGEGERERVGLTHPPG